MEPTPDTARTFHASQAAHVSDMINLKFAALKLGSRYLRATEPDGPSTDGGRKARQALVLVTQDEIRNGLGGVVCGFVDVPLQVAELRSHAVVAAHFAHRHPGQELDVAATDYEQMIEKLQTYLETQGFHTRVELVPRQPSVTRKPTSARDKTPISTSPPVWPMIVTAVAGFALCWVLVRLGVIR